MSFSLAQIFTLSLIYLATLFGSAYATEKGWIPKSFTHHPWLKVISLGVFAGAIAFYGAIGLAAQYGASYLLYFFGASAAFLISPLLFSPLSRIAFTHKLGSLADIFAFRYPAPWVGGLITLLMLVGVMPLIALQIHAMSITVHLLNQDISQSNLAIILCFTMTIFAILFGARHISTREKHTGLIVALALESIFKLMALVAVALYAVYGIFGGFSELNLWLTSNNILLQQAEIQLSEGASRSLLLIFFAAAVALPHMFHILFTENDNTNSIRASRWWFPLYMLVLSMCIPPILWGATKLGITSSPEFYAVTLGLTTGNSYITMVAFIGGFAAASGVIIVITLALASMSLNHILLPLFRPKENRDFFSFLLLARRVLIAGIMLSAYGLYRLFGEQQSLMSLGIVTFVAVLQFIPGLVGAFYWRGANRAGLLAGLIAGFVVWFGMLFFPLMSDIVYSTQLDVPLLFEPTQTAWHVCTILSLSVNCLFFVAFSVLSKSTQDEVKAAEECIGGDTITPYQGQLVAKSALDIATSLTRVMGTNLARGEMDTVLLELNLKSSERRSFDLIRIRNQLESNLSSLLGQTIAHRIIKRALPFRDIDPSIDTNESVHNKENRVEDYEQELTGLAAELNNLRRYHRQIIEDLPTAVCAVDTHFKVLNWNKAMEELTGIQAIDMVDYPLINLPSDWYQLLYDFITADKIERLKQEFEVHGEPRLLHLHKSQINTQINSQVRGLDSEIHKNDDIILVIEDITDEQILERQLAHNQRLASIGQLAAGVAHEIGNPITGIACLAQNLRFETDQAATLEISGEILTQTQRVSSILESLVNFAHGGKSDSKRPMAPVAIKQCIHEAINLLSLASNTKGIHYVVECPFDLHVTGDSQRLLQVIVNVLTNARDASTDLAEVIILCKVEDDRVRIIITDSGYGVSPEDLEHMFEPFYTTKDPGQGTGLGLAIVQSIVEEHHGAISIVPGDKAGTRVTIELPYFDPKDLHLTSPSDSLFS